MESEIDKKFMQIRSGGGLGHFISDFGFQGVSGGARGTDFRSKSDAKSCKTKLGKCIEQKKRKSTETQIKYLIIPGTAS